MRMNWKTRGARTPPKTWLGLAAVLAASAPGCFLPELVIGSGGSGGAGLDASGGSTSSGGGEPGGSGGRASGGAASGGTSAGGTASGGDGAGGGSGGAEPISGYFNNGSWHGFTSTFAEFGQVDPPDFNGVVSPPYCVTGTVEPQANVDGQAGFSWFLNQAATCEGNGCVPLAMTVNPVAEGIVLRLDNPGGSPLRVQVEGPDPSNRWCADLGVANGIEFVRWDAFNTECDGTGAAYANQDLVRMMVLAPGLGQGQGTVSFDFCVELVGESDEPTGNCELYGIPALGTYSLSGAAAANVVRNAQPYVVQGDLWGAASGQVIEGTGTFFEVKTAAAGVAGSYPAAFVGKIGSHDTETPWMPLALFSSRTLSTYLRWNGDLVSGAVALLEMRFATASESPSQVMQVWLAAEDRSPGGNPIAAFTGLPGTPWDGYVDVIEGVQAAIFVAPEPMQIFDDDLRLFMMHAITEGALASDGDIASVSGGFLLSSGGGEGLTIEDFCTAASEEI